jgi:hypothetical protein
VATSAIRVVAGSIPVSSSNPLYSPTFLSVRRLYWPLSEIERPLLRQINCLATPCPASMAGEGWQKSHHDVIILVLWCSVPCSSGGCRHLTKHH